MKIEQKYCTDKKEWEEALDLFPSANFLQSWNWGVFQENMGKTVLRLLFFHKEAVVAAVQMVLENARRGKYFAVAGGPLVDWERRAVLPIIFDHMKTEASLRSAVFIRFRPQCIMTPQVEKTLLVLHAVQAPMHLTADLTLQLDLSLSEEELLKQMRKTTRQMIKKAQAKEIAVAAQDSPETIEAFYSEQLILAQKHGFVPFSYEFLLEQFKAFSKDAQVSILTASLDTKTLASAFVIFYRKEAVYHYGISTAENATLPGSYACQWAAILEAKKRGMDTYNFWGVAPEDAGKDHRFAGVTLFKKGFGGEVVQYVPAQDIVLRPLLYYPVYIFELLRKKFRRL